MMGFSTTAQSVSRFFICAWDKIRKRSQNQNWAFIQELCRRFSLAEIRAATECFNDKFYIGRGAFSSVYKGYINGGATVVAIKRFTASTRDFRNEVQLSCQLRHPNLVPIVGFCEEKGELIHVYDYMPNLALSSKLFNIADLDPLPWKQRLNICIGVARALHYLHAGLKHAIIHRDVKCATILLDERLDARLSNFTTLKMGPPSLSNALIRVTDDRIGGTFGYIDPQYLTSGQVTEKSDVYSFGMVLLEILCAKPIVLLSYRERLDTLCDVMDPFLRGKISPDCLEKFMDVVQRCVRPAGAERPTMGEVEVELECALELQDCADVKKDGSVGLAGDYSYQGMSICEIHDIFSFLSRQPLI